MASTSSASSALAAAAAAGGGAGGAAGGGATNSMFPDISHLTFRDFQHLYEPAEDTYMFVDGLWAEQATLRALRPTVCVEVGTGNGCPLAALALVLGPDWPALYLGTDLNARAATAAAGTYARNGVRYGDVVATDLLSSLDGRLAGKVDVLLFNPPYVPTPAGELGSRGIEAAWAGGDRGREVIDLVLPQVPRWLSPGGVFYMVVVEDNDPAEIQRLMRGLGLKTEAVVACKAKNEKLSLLKFTRYSERALALMAKTAAAAAARRKG